MVKKQNRLHFDFGSQQEIGKFLKLRVALILRYFLTDFKQNRL